MLMHYVYVLKNTATKQLYYGYTSDLNRRYAQHASQGCWALVYYEAYKAAADAHRRERRLKAYGQALRALKERLVESLDSPLGAGRVGSPLI